MAVLPLLFHPVKYFFRLFPRSLIHAGFLDLLLEAAHIGHIFRMELIQLALEKINLFLERIFPVNFLMCLLLCILRLFSDFCHFHELIHRALHLLHTLR